MVTTVINLSSLNGTNGFRVDGTKANLLSGSSVSNAGDVNGDGFDDVIVGAFGFPFKNGEYSGLSYVIFGRTSGFDDRVVLSSLNGSNGFQLEGWYSPTITVSTAGDVNGDGFDDVIIGASGADPNGDRSGSSYVVFGKAAGFSAAMDLSSLDGINGFRLDGAARRGFSGSSVSSAGDINGDGFDDVIVGGGESYAYYATLVTVDYVVFGKASGFSPILSLSDLDGSNGFHLDVNASVALTNSVSSAGDVNGDGFDDVIVGVVFPSPDGNYIRGIASYVVFGKDSGFDSALNLSSLNGSDGFRLTGADFNKYSGALEVSSAGDINGDGFGDLMVGVRSGGSLYYSGASYVVFGKASGFAADLSLFSLDGTNGFRLEGAAEGDYSGSSVNNAGDVNGDGFDDLIIGARGADPNGDRSGSSYVVFGKASGFDATLNLSTLDGNGIRLDGVAVSDGLGTSVSSAGDVNDDGLDDLLVGAPGAHSNGIVSGSSYVIFGSHEFDGIVTYVGTAGNDNFTGTSADERFETSDGNDTMIGGGGADVFQGGSGNDVIRVPDLDFQILDGGAGTDTMELTGGGIDLNLANFHDTINGIDTIDLTGSGDNTLTLTLANLLDVANARTLKVDGNDGDRVVIRGGGWLDGGTDGGYHTYTNRDDVVLQIDVAVSTDPPTLGGVFSLSSLNGSNGFRLDGKAHDLSGWSVSNAGDVNGDGFDDLLVGAPGAEPNGSYSGSSYVIFGRASGFSAAMDLSSLDGHNGFRLDGAAERDYSGRSVSNAGDVNGDGFDDVIVGASEAKPNGNYNYSGSSYVVFGRASGFEAAINLASLDGSNGFRLDGETNDRSGWSVSNAGDVNGDGFDDVIVGAPDAEPNGRNSGSSYVVFGRASGFDAAMDLSSLDGSNGFRLDGEVTYDFSGRSVSSAGDVNGDGLDDLLVGAPFAPNGARSGFSYVVFGKASGFDAALELSSLDGSSGFRLDGMAVNDVSGVSISNAGDVNGDGFDDVIIGAYGAGSSYVVFGRASGFDAALDLSSLDGSNGFRMDGTALDGSGGLVSNAGNVNGDGFADLLVSSNSGGQDIPSYVVFGKASGFDATLDLSSLDGNSGLRLDGVADFNSSQRSVSGAGDVNGDGFDDLLVGASGGGSGSSYVIFGRSDFGGGNVIAGTPGDDKLTGTSAAEIFEAGNGNDRMIGRGGADVFHGDAGDDYIQVTDLGFGLVDGGSGNDVLHTDGKDLNLDLASLNDKIHGIEIICLFGRGDNTLTLTATDLLNLSDTTNTLKVNGNAGDHITVLDDGWVDGGSRGLGYYHVYTNDDAVLLVGMNVTIDFA